MKFNIEIEMTPKEARELFTAIPGMNPLQLMMVDQLKQQWMSDGKPMSDFWQQMSGQSMIEYWNQYGQSLFGSATDQKNNET